MDEGTTAENYRRLVARAWADEAFARRLESDPHVAMAEMGIAIPEGVEIRVLRDTEQLRHFVVPPKPSSEMSDEDLGTITGGIAGCLCGGGMYCNCAI